MKRERSMQYMKRKKRFSLSLSRVIVLAILGVILMGTVLLMLPISSRSGEITDFNTALFTATSASCVTGLVVVDTLTHWSLFGQIVILLLIQIGGLGFMTFVSFFAVIMGKNVGLRQRRLIMESSGTMELGGILHLLRRITLGTLLIESVGAVLLSFRFCAQMGFLKGVYYAVFHSISAFCNAGFDLMGNFSSLSGYATDVYVNVVIMALIIIGGIGFLVWSDVCNYGFRFRRYRLHSKIVLVSTAILIVLGSFFFWLFEKDASLSGFSEWEKVLVSVFQGVTPRTAGFSTINNVEMSDAGTLLTSTLMLIGGSPGSTAGGMKTTTIAVLFIGIIVSATGKKDITMFRRRIDGESVRQAAAIAFLYFAVTIAFTAVISHIEGSALKETLFEVSSAIGTVGSTMSFTTTLGTLSRYLIALLMFGGRAGAMTLALVLAERRRNVESKYPLGKILIG